MRWCGPSFDVGYILCYSLINANAVIIHGSSVIPLKREERNSEAIKEMKLEFNANLKKKLGERAKEQKGERDLTGSQSQERQISD